MDSDTKKYLAIAGGVVAGALTLVFLKNKYQEINFKPIDRATVVAIIKKAKKDNFNTFKQISAMATNIAVQMQTRNVDANMVKAYLESPESPLNPSENFENNFKKACEEFNIKYSDFTINVEYYIKNEDAEIKYLVEEQERDYETSLSGKMPQPKVTVPETLTKERLLEIQQKLTLKKYLLQVDMYRRLRGKTQQELQTNPELMKNLPNQELEEEKILEEEGVGSNDDPPAAVYAAAVQKYRNDTGFKDSLMKIQNEFKKIFNRFMPKMQTNKISEEELNELEDELIYSQPQGY